MTIRSGRSTSTDYISKSHPQGHVVDHVSKGNVAYHIRKGNMGDHISKYTWNNQRMTSVQRKLVCSMSTSDVNDLCHSKRFTSEGSSPENVKSLEVPKDKGPKSLSVV
jgi:hypothetical protein